MFVKITGGSGFIGNHVAKRLADQGHNVTVLDIKKPKIRKAYVYTPGSGESSWLNNIKFDRVDICYEQDIDWAIDPGDFVIHLAAINQYDIAEQNPQLAAAVNVAGTANVLKACINNNASHLIYASTGSVLSKEAPHPFTESTPTNPSTINGMTKLWSEQIIAHYGHKIPNCVLRLPHTYGSGKFWGVDKILMDLMQNKRPTIFGDGEILNDFTYIDDVSSAFELAILKQAKGTYHIGSGKSRSILDFVKWAKLALDKPKIEPKFTVPRKVDYPNFEYNISKAQKELNYQPKYDLETGITKTVEEWSQWL